jgi:hypothetical protein
VFEVGALLERLPLQAQLGFVNQGGGLERPARTFGGPSGAGELTEFAVKGGHELMWSPGLPSPCGTEEARHRRGRGRIGVHAEGMA